MKDHFVCGVTYLQKKDMRTNTCYNLNDILRFGKHRNQRLKDVILKDSQYIYWCLINLNRFSISDSAFQYLEDNCDITFGGGKYKGESLQTVLKKDIPYIWWYIEHYKNLLLSQSVIKELQYSLDSVLSVGVYKDCSIRFLAGFDIDTLLYMVKYEKYFCLNEEAVAYINTIKKIDKEIVEINNNKLDILNKRSIDTVRDEFVPDYEDDFDFDRYEYYDGAYSKSDIADMLAETFNYDSDLMWNID